MKQTIERSNKPNTSPQAKGDRLQRLRNLTNLSRREVSETFNIKHGTLKGWEVGTATGLTKIGADQILKAYESEGVICSYEWLLYGIGSGPRITENIDTVNNTTSYKTDSQNNHSEEKKIIRELQFFHDTNPKTIDLIVKDDGMMPFYQSGDYVAGIRRYDQDITTINGSDCIVQTKAGQILLRNIRKGDSQNCYNLLCTNLNTTVSEPILYNVELVSAAQVVWIRRNR